MTIPVGPVIYNLFPRLVGPVAFWQEHLARIAGLGFSWVYVNPFHYPGFSGSLYAIKDHYRLNPLMDDGTGRSAGRQIADFVADAERLGLAVMMDLVINHTAKDCLLVEAHPEWYRRDDEGGLLSPGAIDPADSRKVTIWGDLAELDFSPRLIRRDMIEYFSAVATYYAGLGVRGFRCDAAYKVPAEVWAEIIEAVREIQPDALFVAETVGCRLADAEQLRPAGFDYLLNSSKWSNLRDPWLLDQYHGFRSVAPSISFPESHDTGRLAAEAPAGVDPAVLCRQRYAFAAVFASGVLMPVGFEFGFRRKLDVVASSPADWERPSADLTGFVAAWNRLRTLWPGFAVEGAQRLVTFAERDVVGLVRHAGWMPDAGSGADWCLTLVNLDLTRPRALELDGVPELEAAGEAVEITPDRQPDPIPTGAGLILRPGEVRVLLSPAATGAGWLATGCGRTVRSLTTGYEVGLPAGPGC